MGHVRHFKQHTREKYYLVEDRRTKISFIRISQYLWRAFLRISADSGHVGHGMAPLFEQRCVSLPLGSVYLALCECSVNICVYVNAGYYMHLLLEATKSNRWVTICMKNVCGLTFMQKVSDTPARTNETFLEKTNLSFAVVNICSLFSRVLHHFATLGMSIPAWGSLCCPVSRNS